MIKRNDLRKIVPLAFGALDVTPLTTRAVLLLFLFFSVATAPGVGQFLIGAFGVPTEEHTCTREVLVSSNSIRCEKQPHPPVPASTANGLHSSRPVSPCLAVSGHRLSNGLRAPLRN